MTSQPRNPDTVVDMWGIWRAGGWVVVPTNLQVRRNGAAVMGAGVALAASKNAPDLEDAYGESLCAGRPFYVSYSHRMVLAPTKDHWRNPSTLSMVRASVKDIGEWLEWTPEVKQLAIPALGCGLGGLSWDVVREELGDLPSPPCIFIPPK